LRLMFGGTNYNQYKPDIAGGIVDDHPNRDIIVSFGRSFIANPDLAHRVEYGLGHHNYNQLTFLDVGCGRLHRPSNLVRDI
jgi:2,4-dienoyl-CoA reductase-like NADH-dependent reductase (Old Yellow Enzyme family)